MIGQEANRCLRFGTIKEYRTVRGWVGSTPAAWSPLRIFASYPAKIVQQRKLCPTVLFSCFSYVLFPAQAGGETAVHHALVLAAYICYVSAA